MEEQYIDYLTQIKESIDYATKSGRQVKQVDMNERFHKFMDKQNQQLAVGVGKSTTVYGVPIIINNNVEDFEIVLK